MKLNTYPAWICSRCGHRYGRGMKPGHCFTIHQDTCGVCGRMEVSVTEPRDYGHLKDGWEQQFKLDQKRVLRKLKPAKFKPLPRDLAQAAAQLHWNLWSMYGLTTRNAARWKAKEPNLSVSDFSWTQEVKDAFYAHPYHKAWVRKMKKRYAFSFALWTLNSEPRDEERET